jgi:hypothetical protein
LNMGAAEYKFTPEFLDLAHDEQYARRG